MFISFTFPFWYEFLRNAFLHSFNWGCCWLYWESAFLCLFLESPKIDNKIQFTSIGSEWLNTTCLCVFIYVQAYHSFKCHWQFIHICVCVVFIKIALFWSISDYDHYQHWLLYDWSLPFLDIHLFNNMILILSTNWSKIFLFMCVYKTFRFIEMSSIYFWSCHMSLE